MIFSYKKLFHTCHIGSHIQNQWSHRRHLIQYSFLDFMMSNCPHPVHSVLYPLTVRSSSEQQVESQLNHHKKNKMFLSVFTALFFCFRFMFNNPFAILSSHILPFQFFSSLLTSIFSGDAKLPAICLLRFLLTLLLPIYLEQDLF